MSLEATINSAIKEAMKAKDQTRLRSLRAIKSGILLAKTEKGASEDLNEATEIKMLQKMVKQRRDSQKMYEDQNREDLAEIEREEADVIETFLPAQLSEEEVKEIISKVIATTGATSPRDMGKVMGMASKELAGRADNALVGRLAKEMLNN